MPSLSIEQWHARFLEQSGWTQSILSSLFNIAEFKDARLGLEVGCGTGAITQSLHQFTSSLIIGIDISIPRLQFAQHYDPQTQFLAADSFHLPFDNSHFDFTFCHYLLLWLNDPLSALLEMARVTRQGGSILVLAEPDYGGRIDFPADLEEFGKLQALSLKKQGANPILGRELPLLMAQARLRDIHIGILGSQWTAADLSTSAKAEWEVLRSDLAKEIPAARLEEFHQLDITSRQVGSRVLFVPTFYAIGKV